MVVLILASEVRMEWYNVHMLQIEKLKNELQLHLKL